MKTGFGGRHEHVPFRLLGAQEVNVGTWTIILKFSYIMKTLAIWSNFRELEHWKESIFFIKTDIRMLYFPFSDLHDLKNSQLKDCPAYGK